MSWDRSAPAALLLSVELLLPGTASAAIVVASSGPSAAQYPAGKKLDDASQITLQKDDSVTVLDQRGTKVLRGPGRFAVSQPGRPLPNPAYTVLTRRDAAIRARTGAVRGDDGMPMSPNLWLVDLGKPGMQCVTTPDAVRLWRADSRRATRYRITSAGGRASVIAFAANTAIANWDMNTVPVSEGTRYTLTREDGIAVGSFRFAVIANPPAAAEELALALIEKGCTTQLDLLSKSLTIARL